MSDEPDNLVLVCLRRMDRIDSRLERIERRLDFQEAYCQDAH